MKIHPELAIALVIASVTVADLAFGMSVLFQMSLDQKIRENKLEQNIAEHERVNPPTLKQASSPFKSPVSQSQPVSGYHPSSQAQPYQNPSPAPSLSVRNSQPGSQYVMKQKRAAVAHAGANETCKYWVNEYKRERSDTSKYYMDEACMDAGRTIVIQENPQPATVINNIVVQTARYAGESVLSAGCHSLNQCNIYQNSLDRILAKMRRGYTAHEYNRLEGERKRWKNRIFDHCGCHPIGSF